MNTYNRLSRDILLEIDKLRGSLFRSQYGRDCTNNDSIASFLYNYDMIDNSYIYEIERKPLGSLEKHELFYLCSKTLTLQELDNIDTETNINDLITLILINKYKQKIVDNETQLNIHNSYISTFSELCKRYNKTNIMDIEHLDENSFFIDVSCLREYCDRYQTLYLKRYRSQYLLFCIIYNTIFLPKEYVKKWNIINNIEKKYRYLLLAIYNNSLDDYLSSNIINKLESFVYSISTIKDEGKIEEHRREMGICIPPGKCLYTYLLNNIKYYRHAYREYKNDNNTIEYLCRYRDNDELLGKILLRYTDRDLIEFMDVYIPYSNKLEQINNYCSIFNKNGFFLPLQRLRCINKQTIVDLDEITDRTIYMIGYGLIDKYHCLTISDLISCIKVDGDIPNIENPFGGKGMQFTQEELSQLLNIIKFSIDNCVKDISQDLILLKDKVCKGIDLLRRFGHKNLQNKNIIKSLSNSDKEIVIKILQLLFYAGMYCRRWDGIGSYPHTESETKVKISDDVISDRVSKQLFMVLDLCNTLDVIYKNLILELSPYNIDNERNMLYTLTRDDENTLGKILNRLVTPQKGDVFSCVRINSTILICTAYHYLMDFFSMSISGLNLNNLHRIS
ncbi:Hypothetical protein ORPV_964 [Orpheovirus IHUMI-LCC2]|uniref:Uncharacterized protein n=1 Tax=Orpheovirus IHUMI-LCC2 TaxID=2023057 RepID=A0A2I2L5P4_9VIRU|nr:Hypothetical protein ORPV_964 [Orpheovirus IHUMI-LCC2]SNW62868.1 Hypothetical protein ORPV_964 [Orpheovirus IHUMI-LCC2]